MQNPHPHPRAHQLDVPGPDRTDDASVSDTHLVVQLHDSPLRALCASAAGLSDLSLLRLEAAAETLRQTEGLAPTEWTSHP
ncbi:hypothetical protein [Nocardia asteroides]|uniref:hypothetical protein n=1 Tax=Nocardia asteroides TaxID=1824 RepID=UPI001E49A19C|nr:hypothetical protein [Nocardia asteroides]UGT55328.1 hypothetical protein LTT85_00150 [Nocardia asteroides]